MEQKLYEMIQKLQHQVQALEQKQQKVYNFAPKPAKDVKNLLKEKWESEAVKNLVQDNIKLAKEISRLNEIERKQKLGMYADWKVS